MISKLLGIFSEHKKLAITVILVNALVNLAKTVIDPLVMKILVDDALGQKDLQLFMITIAIVVFLSISLRTIMFYVDVAKRKLINMITQSKTKELMGRYFNLPYREVAEKGEGYFISRVYDEPAQVSEKGTHLAVGLFQNGISFIGAFGICIYLSWEVTLALLFIVPILFVLSRRYSRRIYDQSEKEGEHHAEFRDDMIRCLETYKLSNLFNLRQRVTNSVIGVMSTFLSTTYERNRTSQVYQTLSNIFLSMAESVVLVVAAAAVFLGTMTVGGLLAYMSGFWKMMNALVALIDKVPEISNLMAYFNRVDQFGSDSQTKASNKICHINLDKVNLAYTDAKVVENFDLQMRYGEKLLIQGGNGTGKSTLLHGISGFLEFSGEHEVPDQQRISALLSPMNFFKGSLAEHLELDNRSFPSKALIENMLFDFGLMDKLDRDPIDFSEGEKRKAQIAICLAKEADLYIFDEPLAAVDVNSKEIVMGWIRRVTKGKSVLAVLHGDERFYKMFDRQVSLDRQEKLLV
ncbi:ABC transporter ATP-binding protein [Shewanella algae]|uniref:ABC transporter permease n=1 Tax=Shewanella algae TaxID=38313 RepID=A0AAD1K647_9GAMM|nr:ABC transporter ATP-binding protein [Shewanella algae]AYV12125.1 ABC transporter ATP-binding protein [Shewanella algae]MBO2567756.1 ABC transporter ATP-binding protein [Shewanella algae]MBO2593501.1 ABC transporter ATP-binding protein [Shewanella algae]MBO2664943.1 ABC transporter ATP-binding protein [Shewanella algae]MBO2677605.1 ABC transporter ATP-binding protein [Shewanella algae]